MDKKHRFALRKTTKGLVSCAIASLLIPVVGGTIASADGSVSESGVRPVSSQAPLLASQWRANSVLTIKNEIKAQLEEQKDAGTYEYVVQWGDTVWGITQAFDLDMDVFVQINRIENPELIYVGEVFTLDLDGYSLDHNDDSLGEAVSADESESDRVASGNGDLVDGGTVGNNTEQPVEDLVDPETPVVNDGDVDEPVEDEGETEDPVEDEGETEDPVEDEGDVDEPVEDEGETEDPVEDESETEDPVEDEGETEDPVEDEGETEDPVEDEGETEDPVEDEDETEDPVEVEDETEDPVEDEGETEDPVEDEDETEDPVEDEDESDVEDPVEDEGETEDPVEDEDETDDPVDVPEDPVEDPDTEDPVEEEDDDVYAFDLALLNTEMLALINAERARVGVNPLSYDAALAQGAAIRVEELLSEDSLTVNGVGHVRPDGTPFNTAFAYLGNGEEAMLGENIAQNWVDIEGMEQVDAGTTTIEKVLARQFYDQYYNSPGHYQNMINGQYTAFATDVRISEQGKTFNVQIFSLDRNNLYVDDDGNIYYR